MKRRKLIFAIFLSVMLFLTCLIEIMPTTKIFAEETSMEQVTTISNADELIAFAELVNSTDGSTDSIFNAKLTADINLNPGVKFKYDHETGLVTVEKDGKSYKMGTGMRGTELGSFHPVYNGLCTQDEWNNEEIINEERKNELIAEMSEKVESLGLIKWIPIGTEKKPYLGIFDGNGHKIDGLYINDNSIQYTGLFGVKGNYKYLPDIYDVGEVKNLSIGENSLIVGYKLTNNGSTGAFVGKTQFDKISECTNYATVVGKGSKSVSNANCGLVGGIAGFINGKVQGCINYGTIVSPESAGGIVGNIMGNSSDRGSVLYCKNYGNVYADTELVMGYAGGIAVNAGGYNSSADFSGPIEACINYGYVEGCYAGGITRRGARGVKINYCANFGAVAATSSAAGIVEYIDNGDFYMEGCYNAGVISVLENNLEDDSGLYKIAYPIASLIRKVTGNIVYHSIKNCYNDKDVYPTPDDILFGENIKADNCYSVTTEFFATGEPAYKMGSYNSKGWRQNLSANIEEGQMPEKYPTVDGKNRVFFQNHYCCHTDSKNKEAHKESFYTNSSKDVIDEHTPNENGICTHCGLDVRLPEFLLDELPEAKVGNYYDITIKLNEDIPLANKNIKAIISDTDDNTYQFTKGLNGKADYSGYSGYYYYISGIPTEEGTLTFTLVAENDNGVTKKTYTIKINKADPIEISTNERLDNATVGTEYNNRLTCSTDLDKTWALNEDSKLPDGFTLGADGSISGIATKAGKYSFTIMVTAGGQTVSKTFTIVVLEEGGCNHEDMKKVTGTAATCKNNGIKDYYHCDKCECDFFDKEGKNEISNFNDLITVTNHSDKDNNGKCDFCGKNMPEFKKITNKNEITYGDTYILVTKIGSKYYALTIPANNGVYDYNEFMVLSEITPKANGDFDFNDLEKNNVVMLKTEFASDNEELDKTMLRFGFSTILNNVRYSFVSEGNANFAIYPNEPAKYGYTITLNDLGEAVIESVYQKWWNDSKTSDNGTLRAFDMTYNKNNVKFMSFFGKNSYEEEYSESKIVEYPIYLYKMTNIVAPSFATNDTDSDVSKGDFDLPDIVDLSNVKGIAEAVNEEYFEKLIEEVGISEIDASANLYARITITNLEKDLDSETLLSLRYSVVPMITILDESGKPIYQGVISDSNFNGKLITVTLYAGDIAPAQIVHHKEDGTKEYFYAEWTEQAKRGEKSFLYKDGFVTFTVDSFSEIEILSTIKYEESNKSDNNGSIAKNNLDTITIVVIVLSSTIILAICVFAIIWFVVKKKTFKELFKK